MVLLCKIKGHDYSGTYTLTPKGGESIDCAIFCSRCGDVINLALIIEKVLPIITQQDTGNP